MKKPRQRAMIILRENDKGGFDMDCNFEPSIKGKPETPLTAAVRDILQYAIGKYVERKRIIVP